MAVPPADLSVCDTCKRPVPPSNHPQFAKWRTVKGETGRVSGMRCPECLVAKPAEAS